MKKNILVLLTASIALLAGCSSTPAKVNEGPIHARTFSFVTSAKSSPAYADPRAAVHQMIHEAITKNLTARGLQKTDTPGDITVAYLVIVGDNASTELIDDYFGYGRDASVLHGKAQEAYTENKNPNYFQAGSLLIDLIDSKNFKLLKRGYASRPRLRNLPEDAKAARVQEAVDEILRDVQIAP
jgi:hypothetical protein